MPDSVTLPPADADYLRLSTVPGGYRPDYDRCLTGVLPTLFSLLGQPTPGRDHLLDCLPKASPREAKRVLLLTVDALGFKELALGSRLSALQRDYGTWITSVFPSITSAAMSSLYQALPPSRHGIPGHLIWKDYPGAIVDMLRMRVPGAKASLGDAGFDTLQWQREPGLLATPPQPVVPGFHLMPWPIVDSGLSEYSYGRTVRVGYADLVEGVTKVGEMLSDHEQAWVSLYTPTVDTLSHLLTGDAPQMALALGGIEAALTWLAHSLPARVVDSTVLLVTADHGQDSIQERIAIHSERGDWLRAHTKAVGYSGRTLHLYLGDHPAAPVAAWFRDLLAGRGVVLPFEEAALLAGLTPQDTLERADWLRRSLGDLVAVLHAGYNWERREPSPEPPAPYASRLVSQHGALSPNELFVPFICAPLAAIGGSSSQS